MPVTRLLIEDFIAMTKDCPVFDVRSPGEYDHAHLPGAHSLPLFTNEERKVVGTAYKQESKQKAVKLGLEYFGPKMVKMVEEVEGIVDGLQLAVDRKNRKVEKKEKEITDKKVLVYCWRGGMRSAGVAWLLDLYGFKVYTLVGGYKSYRNWVLKQFEKEYPFKIIGGYTGSGKTELLHALQQKGETIIDLEGIACHRGSAFGNLGQVKQPGQEMFENLLARELEAAGANNTTIWLEDESQRIGEVNIPMPLFKFMRTCRVYFLDIPFEERLQYVVAGYGKFKKEDLINATVRIQKRLGGLEAKTAINCLIENDLQGAFGVLLHYYDRFYTKSMSNMREQVDQIFHKISVEKVDASLNASKILSVQQQEQSISSTSL